MNNKYVNRSKISEAKFRELIRLFVLDLNAKQISELVRLNRNTVNRYLQEIRKKIDLHCTSTSTLKRVHTNSERDILNVTPCILIKESYRRIYADVHFVKRGNGQNTDHWKSLSAEWGYDLLIDKDSGRHIFLGDKSKQQEYRSKMNLIKSFWGTYKNRLVKFKGIHSSTLQYHIRECEFRFNNRHEDLYALLLKIIRKDPLF